MWNVVRIVDAFTPTPFRGNPAAVLLLERPAPEAWMKDLARELNLSETAYLLPEPDGYRLRWFTPTVEIPLCGHATLASAHVLWEEGILAPDQQARFHTMSGLLTADRQGDWIRLDFPATPPARIPPPPDMLEALGIEHPVFTGRTTHDYFVEVESADAVRALGPDMARLARVSSRGFIVTARGDDDYDFISRFFAPAAGIAEDPVTGSAHCGLTPYWADRLGKDEMLAYQASERGGVVKVVLKGDRVWLCGQAVTVMRSELLPPARAD